MVGSPPAEVNLLVDPYGKKQNLAGLTGGEIGGLLQFRQSVLDTSWSDLNYLAQVVSSEVNKTLKGVWIHLVTGAFHSSKHLEFSS